MSLTDARPLPVDDGVAVPLPRAEDALEVLARGSRSFSFAGWFLPEDRRADAALLYALCRYVDDVADDAPSPVTARIELDRIMAELLGEAEPRALLRDVLAMFERRRIDPRHAVELCRGVASDLDTVRIADDGELIRYAYRVAGTVGLMMCGVLGVEDDAALPHAVDLGVAMQITNICRDVLEDGRNGRVYLPATRLRAAGVEPDPAGVLAGRAGVSAVTDDLLGLAERYYRSADDGMRYIPWKARLAILIAGRVYRAIGLRLRRHGADPLAGRTVVPGLHKVGWALVGVWQAIRGFGPPRSHRASLHRALEGLPGAHPTNRSAP